MKKVIFIISCIEMMFVISTTTFAVGSVFIGETQEYTNLSDTSVTIWGSVLDNPNDGAHASPPYYFYFEYWEEGSEDIITVGNYSTCTTENLCCNLRSLKPNTKYYYKACYSDNVMSFTTLPYPQPKTTTEVFKEKSYFDPSTYYYDFQVSPQSLTSNIDRVYIALYKDDEFVGAILRKFENTRYVSLDTKIDFDYAKVMVWNKDTMAPVTTPEIVYNPFN